MGTPSEKAKTENVVMRDLQEEEEQPASVGTSDLDSTSSNLHFEAMGVQRRILPRFESFTDVNICSARSEFHSKVENVPPGSSFVSLKQAHIEDYFVHSKYYPSCSETRTTFPIMPVQEYQKACHLIDQPGSSGLQISKVKSLPSKGKLKMKPTPTSQHSIKNTHTCSSCQKSFLSLDKFVRHQRSHTGASPFKCENCKKAFTSKFKLVRHSLIHSDCKPFTCTVCDRKFHRKDHLKNHIKVHVPGKKIYVCQKQGCQKEYTALLSYRKHLALHAAEEGGLQCQICYNVFEDKEQILYHLKIHAGSRAVKNPNEKKFTCEYCDRKFFTRKDVRRHLVVHTGMRDFLCQFCPQRFGRKDHLVRHIKKSHSKHFAGGDANEVYIKHEATETFPVLLEIKTQGESSRKTECSSSSPNLKNMVRESESSCTSETLEEQVFPITQFLQSETSGTSTTEDIAKAYESTFDDVNEPAASSALLQENRLLEATENTKLPLPGFSQTFQSPPPSS